MKRENEGLTQSRHSAWSGMKLHNKLKLDD